MKWSVEVDGQTAAQPCRNVRPTLQFNGRWPWVASRARSPSTGRRQSIRFAGFALAAGDIQRGDDQPSRRRRTPAGSGWPNSALPVRLRISVNMIGPSMLKALPERLKKPKNSPVRDSGVIKPMIVRLTDCVPPITSAVMAAITQNCHTSRIRNPLSSTMTHTARQMCRAFFWPILLANPAQEDRAGQGHELNHQEDGNQVGVVHLELVLGIDRGLRDHGHHAVVEDQKADQEDCQHAIAADIAQRAS